MSRALLLCVAAVLLAGCASDHVRVHTAASREFECGEDDVEVTRRGTETYVAVGCARQGVFQCQRGRCVNLMSMARQRASREHDCAFEMIGVREVTPYVFQTEGCGTVATYHCEILAGAARCMLESRQQRASDPASVPTEPEPGIELL